MFRSKTTIYRKYRQGIRQARLNIALTKLGSYRRPPRWVVEDDYVWRAYIRTVTKAVVKHIKEVQVRKNYVA